MLTRADFVKRLAAGSALLGAGTATLAASSKTAHAEPPSTASETDALLGESNDGAMTPLLTRKAIQNGPFYGAGEANAAARTLIDKLRDQPVSPDDYQRTPTMRRPPTFPTP